MYNKATLIRLKKELEETYGQNQTKFDYKELVRFINGKIQDPREPWETTRDNCS